ncbi:uncharacterized protein N7506_009419 [Penicillium brevicompactum]|uniref:uncharacterized protein n=1 Tax=Penicillium brevicompactum TaxID=5074 RepID=UPI0025400FA6|nr:uncharacterized protein N7506_009419 [Penicillium brevicompactum]KAJ5326317.1 hypothetical protein N7506_009419 [Penicillium brevicompactum]
MTTQRAQDRALLYDALTNCLENWTPDPQVVHNIKKKRLELLDDALEAAQCLSRSEKAALETGHQLLALLNNATDVNQRDIGMETRIRETEASVQNSQKYISKTNIVRESLQADRERVLRGEEVSESRGRWRQVATSLRENVRVMALLGSTPQQNIAAQDLNTQSGECNSAEGSAEDAKKGPNENSQSPCTKQDIDTRVLESNSAASGEKKPEKNLQSPAAEQDIDTRVLESNSAASGEKKPEENLQSPAAEQDIMTPVSGSNLAKSKSSETEELPRLILDYKQDIVSQILASSSQNAPALSPDAQKSLASADASFNEDEPENQREALKHIARYIETKHRGQLSPQQSSLVALDAPMAPVPGLSFGLDRVLFNPGVYQLRDPRSRVYNFDPYLGEVMPVSEFDYSSLKPYITSSQDVTALEMAAKHQKKYFGSSSSMTSVLSHFHYLLSAWRPVSVRQMSSGFPENLRNFTRLLRAPAAMFLHYKEKEDTYAIDADKEYDSANILANLGKSMEKMLTLPKEEFERYRRSSPNKIDAEEESAIPESYHFTGAGNFLMRSQLDAYDPRLPGTGMYDLKTRAVVSIRMDVRQHENGMGYEIKDRFGTYESFEREYFDMIRAAFLKYSLQVRIGRMDGIFVAYHNIERIFGFQYISLPEMDQSLHGQNNTILGDREFELSLGLWEKIMDRATEKFPKQSLRFHFETREGSTPFMYIFAEPVTDQQIRAIQTKNKAEIDAFNDRLFNPNQPLSEVMDLGSDNSSEEPPTFEETPVNEDAENQPDAQADGDVLAMTLITQNKVNGRIVDRPENLRAKDQWDVSYELNELDAQRGKALLRMMKKRRADTWLRTGDDETGERDTYLKLLDSITQRGRAFREKEKLKDAEEGIIEYETSRKSG